MLIDDDTRHRSYCLLLLSRVDVAESELREQARKYGLDEEIDALLRYLDTEGQDSDDRLPAWDEFEELAEVIALEAGDGEPIDDPDEFLQDIDVDPDTEDKELPDFLR